MRRDLAGLARLQGVGQKSIALRWNYIARSRMQQILRIYESEILTDTSHEILERTNLWLAAMHNDLEAGLVRRDFHIGRPE